MITNLLCVSSKKLNILVGTFCSSPCLLGVVVPTTQPASLGLFEVAKRELCK